MRAVVVANGIFPDPTPFQDLLDGADLVAAADGGARTLLRLGQRVDVVLGDMDSLDADLYARWQNSGGRTLTFAPEKDETDLELALRHVVAQGARHVVVLGALGGRLDHELANLLLLAAPFLDGIAVEALDQHTRAIAVKAGANLAGRAGDTLSLLPVTAQVTGISTTGLYYPLDGDTLLLGPARGVSNVFTGDRASVTVQSGVLLAIHTWTDERALQW